MLRDDALEIVGADQGEELPASTDDVLSVEHRARAFGKLSHGAAAYALQAGASERQASPSADGFESRASESLLADFHSTLFQPRTSL